MLKWLQVSINSTKKTHGIAMKVLIQNGSASNHGAIEALVESARTGIHASSVRITYVRIECSYRGNIWEYHC